MIAKNSKISNCNIKFIEEKITFFQETILSTILSSQKYKILDILNANEIYICIQNLELLFTKLNTITNKLNIVINENITPNFGEILNILQEINNDLSSILKNYGTQNLSDLIIIALVQILLKKLYK